MSIRGELPNYQDCIEQSRETDLEILERLSEEFDLVLKIEDRNITLTPYSTLEGYASIFNLGEDQIEKDGTSFTIKDYRIYKGVVLSWFVDVQPMNWNVPVISSGNANLNTSVNVNTNVNIPNISLEGNSSFSSSVVNGTINGVTSDGKTVSGSCQVTVPGKSFSVNVSGSASGSGSGSGSGSSSGNINSSGSASVPREKT
jgi:hypothetical protein